MSQNQSPTPRTDALFDDIIAMSENANKFNTDYKILLTQILVTVKERFILIERELNEAKCSISVATAEPKHLVEILALEKERDQLKQQLNKANDQLKQWHENNFAAAEAQMKLVVERDQLRQQLAIITNSADVLEMAETIAKLTRLKQRALDQLEEITLKQEAIIHTRTLVLQQQLAETQKDKERLLEALKLMNAFGKKARQYADGDLKMPFNLLREELFELVEKQESAVDQAMNKDAK